MEIDSLTTFTLESCIEKIEVKVFHGAVSTATINAKDEKTFVKLSESEWMIFRGHIDQRISENKASKETMK